MNPDDTGGPNDPAEIERREFLKRAGLATAGALLATGAVPGVARGSAATSVSIVIDPADPVASAAPARWAAGELQQVLRTRSVPARICERLGDATPSDVVIVATGRAASLAVPAELRPADVPEALAIGHGKLGERAVLVAAGSDVRGLVFALTELADVVTHASGSASVGSGPEPALAMAALDAVKTTAERPANAVRSCMRMFCSDVEDKPWFGDREFWNAYLSMLVAQRFNRINLAFGIGYDFTTGITDAYLHFAYPFLLDVPGYDVRATNVTAAERDANLERLRFISDAAAARGLHFQLGLWTHAYEWTKSPDANHRIEGLTAQTHGPYCRDALTQLLKACPNISGVTFRIHGESGVAEGSYEFWKTVFEGVRRAGRRIEIDMHAKGMDERMIDTAVASGLPLMISPKFWAEHMGLPYHQAWIRPTELPQRDRGDGLFANSSGSRSFLRYGYGDLLAEDRPYRLLHRIWPGTQRLLQWGDPTMAAAYGRASSFCGSAGCDLMEPLSFKGRKGSGQKGSGEKGARTARVDAATNAHYDFETYRYTYRLWGRLLYNPDARPETWQRLLRTQYGAAASSVEGALAAASRVLPLVTTAHMPSAANNNYWPEMYANMSIGDASHPEPFGDTPVPKRFGTVSPLDPQLFSSADDCVAEWLQGKPSGRYSPIEVAARLEDLAADAARQLTEATSKSGTRVTNVTAAATATISDADGAFRRVTTDVGAQIELARFYASKLRAGVLYALFLHTGDKQALASAVERYRAARDAWSRLVEQTNGRFVEDVTFGPGWFQRGHWRDRLAAIDEDLAALEQTQAVPAAAAAADTAPRHDLIDAAIGRPTRPRAQVRHTPAAAFQRGQAVPIELAAIGPAAASAPVTSVTLRYRRTNQAEPWRAAQMSMGTGRDSRMYRATIPADYGDSPYPLQYYFELLVNGSPASSAPAPAVTLYPGFDEQWCNQPYFVVRQDPRYMRNTPNFAAGIGAL
jgi:hypothetical protein